MGTFSIGGTAKQRSLARVDPRLVDIMRRAAAASPYNVQLFSGIRPGDKRFHGKGVAVDIVLSDPQTGQEIPNLKSATGFPIYEQFAKTARDIQQQAYPDLGDSFRWGGYFGGGKGKYGSVDLMHFDLGPTSKMAGGSWETGLTPTQAKIVASMGDGQIYSGQGQRNAGPGEYVNLWGREPLQAQPQDAQSAIASLLDPGGGTQVAEPPTAAMGYAPTIPDAGFGMPPPPTQVAGAPPMPQPPPQWAQATGFPIDEALTGRSAQDVLTGGPRMDPRRAGPATGPMPPDMGAMLSPADVLNAGPNLDPRRAIGSAPVGPTTPQGVLDMGPRLRPPGPEVDMPTPPMRPGNFVFNGGGAPPAPPMPPSNPRRDPFGFPIDVNRPALANGDGSISTEETTTFDAAEVGMPPEIVTVPTIINGRRVSEDEAKAAFASGQNPPVQRGFANYADAEAAAQARTDAIPGARATGSGPFASSFPPRPEGPAAPMPGAPGMSAAMGNAPPIQLPPRIDPAAQDARMADFEAGMESDRIARDLYTRRREMQQYVPDYRTGPPPTMGERFDDAAPFPNAGQMFGLPPMNDASFPAPPPVIGTAEAGSTTGEFFTPAPPMPAPPPDPLAGRFDDAFSPGGPGMVMDLQGVYDARQTPAPPTMTAQDGINQVFGAPPAPASVPNLAIPFAEVPGIGPSPAEAATIASPLPQPMTRGEFSARFDGPPVPSSAPQPISQREFDERFAGGTVVPAPPQPGQPGVVSGEMPTPEGAMDIRSPVQGGPGLPPAPVAPSPAQPPRQTNPGAERQKNGIIGRVLGGLLGGPLGALGGGLLGGGGGGGFGFGTPSFSPTGGGNAPYMQPNGQMGSTTYQKGTSNALGGSNALSWKTSSGRTITAYTDPNTGQTFHSYGP